MISCDSGRRSGTRMTSTGTSGAVIVSPSSRARPRSAAATPIAAIVRIPCMAGSGSRPEEVRDAALEVVEHELADRRRDLRCPTAQRWSERGPRRRPRARRTNSATRSGSPGCSRSDRRDGSPRPRGARRDPRRGRTASPEPARPASRRARVPAHAERQQPHRRWSRATTPTMNAGREKTCASASAVATPATTP